jgi:hypothetical protein
MHRMNPTRMYRFLLGLYPKDQRDQFGAEMEAVFWQAAEEHRSRGAAVYVWFAMREFAGLVAGAAAARLASLARRAPAGFAITEPVVFPDDPREVERIVRVNIDRMVHAIAHHQFVAARFYSLVERRARARLDELRGQ